MKGLFVTGLDTGIGKTVASAVLLRALNGEYWKPIQCGDLDNSDTDTVKRFVPRVHVHRERFRLKEPQSPHRAAEAEQKNISLNDFEWPSPSGFLIVEGAGGVLVPLNDKDHIIDLAVKFQLPVVVVARHYLGGLNHALLTVEELKRRELEIMGFIFGGNRDDHAERFLKRRTGLPVLLHMDQAERLDRFVIEKYALEFKWKPT